LIGLLGWGISPSQGDNPHRTTKTEKKPQTSMPRVGFETTIPVFERGKTVRAATVIGIDIVNDWKLKYEKLGGG
jgi:hypothetical protein